LNKLKKNIRLNRIFIVIIIAFSFILYGNTINNDYCLDDNFVIQDNEQVHKGIKGIPEILTSTYSEGKGRTYGYRPFGKITFAIEYSIFGENPHISHLINILLYAITGVFLFLLLIKFLNKYSVWLSFIIVLLFLAHPIHTEVVASLKNREEILSFLGGLSTLYFFYKFVIKKNWIYILPAILCFILGYLSKENIFVFAALIPLSLYFFTNANSKKIFLSLLLLAIIGYIIRQLAHINLSIDKEMMYFENPLYIINSLNNRIIIGFSSLYEYIKLLVFPYPLRHYYGYNMIPFSTWFSFRIIISVIFHLCIFIIAILNFKKKKVVVFGILYYLLAISMFSNIYIPVSGIVGERLVYSASLGFSIVTGFLLFKILSKNKKEFAINYKIIIVLLIILIPYTIGTINRNKAWKDNITLFESDHKHLENSAKANVLYAGTLLKEIRTNKNNTRDSKKQIMLKNSVDYYKRGLKVYPQYTNALKSLGNIYFEFYKDFKTAEKYYIKALKTDSTNSDILLNLGYIYEMKNNNIKAIQCYNIVVKHDSLNINALELFANINNKIGNIGKAIELNKIIMQIEPNSDIPYINIGNYYLLNSDTATSVKYWEKAIEKVPKNANLCNGLYRYFQQHGDSAKAKYYFNLLMNQSYR